MELTHVQNWIRHIPEGIKWCSFLEGVVHPQIHFRVASGHLGKVIIQQTHKVTLLFNRPILVWTVRKRSSASPVAPLHHKTLSQQLHPTPTSLISSLHSATQFPTTVSISSGSKTLSTLIFLKGFKSVYQEACWCILPFHKPQPEGDLGHTAQLLSILNFSVLWCKAKPSCVGARAYSEPEIISYKHVYVYCLLV